MITPEQQYYREQTKLRVRTDVQWENIASWAGCETHPYTMLERVADTVKAMGRLTREDGGR